VASVRGYIELGVREGLLQFPGGSDRADAVIPSVDKCKRDMGDAWGVAQELSRAEPGVVDKVVCLESADSSGFVREGRVRARFEE
jgi:hypothetical protein